MPSRRGSLEQLKPSKTSKAHRGYEHAHVW
jgi:hypothetical protein